VPLGRGGQGPMRLSSVSVTSRLPRSRDVLRQITVPTLLLDGDRDVRSPAAVAGSMHAQIRSRAWCHCRRRPHGTSRDAGADGGSHLARASFSTCDSACLSGAPLQRLRRSEGQSARVGRRSDSLLRRLGNGAWWTRGDSCLPRPRPRSARDDLGSLGDGRESCCFVAQSLNIAPPRWIVQE
jgi:hypothetical protein